MDDYKIILYIVGVILYWFFTKFIKGRQPNPENQNPEYDAPETPSAKLEDILKQHLPKRSRQEVQNNAESVIKEKLAPSRQFSYENTPVKAYSLENKQDAELIRQRARQREADAQLKYHPKQAKAVHPIAAMLQTRDGARNAIILSEVLNRKEY